MIIDSLLQLMAERKASDLFVSAGTPIHIKIHGSTMPINQQRMDAVMITRLIGEILSPEQLARFEHERELNFSLGRRELGNFRINLFWQRASMAMVVRHIGSEIPSVHALGLPAVLREVVMEKRGLVLVAGASGAGKSTTLAAMIDHRSQQRGGHILTVEDPIEYLFSHRKSVVNQREIGIDTRGWQEALRNAMRQAPDCILIGEIRDRETMQAALAYAQSGHLVLASLHANNAYHALNRIVNFFALENRHLLHLDLAASLRCVISQRLLRSTQGGQLPAVEVLMNTRHIGELIENGKFNDIRDAMERSLAPGSQTFEQHLFDLHDAGLVTLDEALAHADSATNLYWLINNRPPAGAPAPAAAAEADASANAAAKLDGASFEEFSMRLEKS